MAVSSGSIFRGGVAQKDLWVTLCLLSIAVLAPALAVLWLIKEASENQKLALLRILDESREQQLALGVASVENIVSDLEEQASRLLSNRTPLQAFKKAIDDDLADSVVIWSSDGSALYPSIGSIVANSNESSILIDELLSSIRDLTKEGKTDQALDEIEEWFSSNQENKSSMLKEGRSPHAILALLAADIASDLGGRKNEFIDILKQVATDYTIPMPSPQRQFTLRKYLDSTDNEVARKLLDAERAAAKWVESWGSSAFLRKDLGGIAISARQDDRNIDLLFSRERFQRYVNEQLALSLGSESSGESLLFIHRDQIGEIPNTEFLDHIQSGIPSPDWSIAITGNANEHANDQSAQFLYYSWIGMMTIVLSVSLVIVVVGLVRKQASIAQLKNDLTATVSHELKTPVASIRLLTDTLLKDEKNDPERLRDYLSLISKENKRLGSLIENFLSFSRMERDKNNFILVPTSPIEIAEEAISAFHDRFTNAEAALDVNIEGDLPEVSADKEAMTTAVGNLLENAFKYGGEEKRIQFRIRKKEGNVLFEVEDWGSGIPKKDQKKIFQRFYQGSRKLSEHAGGVGLGLSIVSFIVSKHNGTIELESEEGRGSLFRIIIPHADA